VLFSTQQPMMRRFGKQD